MKSFLMSTTCLCSSMGMIPWPHKPYRNNENAADEVHGDEKRVVYYHPVPIVAFIHWLKMKFKVEIREPMTVVGREIA